MTDLEEVQGGLVELWGRLAPFWGVAPTTARVHGWLLGRDEPADGQGIADGLGASRGAVSMACRELMDWGLVLTERPSGSRRVLYRAETDLERAIRGIVATRKRREWDPLTEPILPTATIACQSHDGFATTSLVSMLGLAGRDEPPVRFFRTGSCLRDEPDAPRPPRRTCPPMASI